MLRYPISLLILLCFSLNLINAQYDIINFKILQVTFEHPPRNTISSITTIVYYYIPYSHHKTEIRAMFHVVWYIYVMYIYVYVCIMLCMFMYIYVCCSDFFSLLKIKIFTLWKYSCLKTATTLLIQMSEVNAKFSYFSSP